MTKKELKQYIWIQDNIKYLEDKLEELKTTAANTNTKLSDMPKGSPSKDSLANIVCKIVEVQEKVNKEVEKGYQKMKEIEKSIENLDEREKRLIRLRYIKGLKWEKICVEMNYSWRQIHRLHAGILKEIRDKNNI
jgi:DNA-directed RNA polymerase specialized sigma subunit